MSLFTLFISPMVAAYEDESQDPGSAARCEQRIMGQARHNVLYYRVQKLSLAAAETRIWNPPGLSATKWAVLYARVVGSVRLNLSGKDLDNTTNVVGKMAAQGTEKMPGLLVLSSYNLTGNQTIEALTASTVELFVGVVAPDGDTLLDTNA